MTLKESSGPSQTVVSSKDDLFDVFDTAFDPPHASCDSSVDFATLPSGRSALRPKVETGEIRSTASDGDQTSNSGDEREPCYGPSSTLLDRSRTNNSAEFSSAKPADCLTEFPSLSSRIRSPTASTPASSRLHSLSPESQVWGTASTQTSCTSMSAPGNGEDEIDDQICTAANRPENAANNPREREYISDEEPLMSQIPPRAQNKRLRESLVYHGSDQSEAEGLRGAPDDPGYSPSSTSDESEGDSDSPSGDEEPSTPQAPQIPRRAKQN